MTRTDLLLDAPSASNGRAPLAATPSQPAPPVAVAAKLEIPLGLCQCGCGSPTRIATKTDRGHGHVKGQPLLYVVGHSSRWPRRTLWISEDRGYSTPCWIWQMAINADGYGMLTRRGRQRIAHRMVYEELRGAIPTGMQIDHLCRVRECVNPDHLEPVSGTENTRRGDATRLTRERVMEIRSSTRDASELANAYGVTEKHIQSVRNGRYWPDVQCELDLERPASGIAALLTGSGSREPAPVEPCRRPRCPQPATTTGDCLAHRLQVQYDADEEAL